LSIFRSIRQLFKNSAIYGIGYILSRFINFLLLPLYTDKLTEAEYGVVGIFFTYIAILFIVYTYGLSSAFFRFFLAKGEKKDKERVCSTALITLMITSLSLSIILVIFAEPVSRLIFSREIRTLSVSLPYLVRMAAVILAFDSIGLLGYLIVLSEERPVLFAMLKLLFVLVNVGANILFVIVMKKGIEGIFLANAIASVVSMISVLPLIMKYSRPVFSFSLLKDLMAFGLPYIIVNASVVVMDMIDRPLLERLKDINEAGLFNAGVKLGMIMAMCVSAFRFAWMPFFMSHVHQENAKATFSKVFTYLMLAFICIFLVISLYINQIVQLKIFGFYLMGEKFWSSITVAPVVQLAYIFDAAYMCFIVGVYLEKKTRLLSYITAGGMAVNILLNVLLIPSMGMMGSAWARVGAYLVMAVSVYFVSQPLYHVNYEWSRVIKLSVTSLALFWIGSCLPVAFRILPLISLPVILWILRFWPPEEIRKIKTVLNSRLKFQKS
jgi:O-antigen/teichoic acid export membrane protein